MVKPNLEMNLQAKTYDEAKQRAIRYSENRKAKLARSALKSPQGENRAKDSQKASKSVLGGTAASKTGFQRRGKRLNPRGKKVKAWEAVRAWLKPRFEKRGIISCEFAFIRHECWHAEGLGFAHSHKRRDPNFQMYAVALACPVAHQILDEVFSHHQMAIAVFRAIENHGGVIKP